MMFKPAFIILIVSVFFITSASWAAVPVDEQLKSGISSSTPAALEPLVKGSSGGSRSSSSSSSSKTKVKTDSDDNNTNSTNDGSGSSWWTIILVLVFVGVIALVVIWYLVIRK
ncbi:MAG: hypothetical protein BME94_07055 [Methanobacteriales archaeon Met13]